MGIDFNMAQSGIVSLHVLLSSLSTPRNSISSNYQIIVTSSPRTWDYRPHYSEMLLFIKDNIHQKSSLQRRQRYFLNLDIKIHINGDTELLSLLYKILQLTIFLTVYPLYHYYYQKVLKTKPSETRTLAS